MWIITAAKKKKLYWTTHLLSNGPKRGQKELLESTVHKIQKSGVYHSPQSPTCFGHDKPPSADIFNWLWILINKWRVWQLIIGVYMKHNPKDATINSNLTYSVQSHVSTYSFTVSFVFRLISIVLMCRDPWGFLTVWFLHYGDRNMWIVADIRNFI